MHGSATNTLTDKHAIVRHMTTTYMNGEANTGQLSRLSDVSATRFCDPTSQQGKSRA